MVPILLFLSGVAVGIGAHRLRAAVAAADSPPALAWTPIPETPSRIAGQRWLLIGDSHAAGWPGDALVAALSAAGAYVTQSSHPGMRTKDVLNTPRLRGPALQTDLGAHPDGIIFMLGTNDVASPQLRGQYEQVKAWALGTGAREVWWIGPPEYGPGDIHLLTKVPLRETCEHNIADARAVFGDRFIDSRPLTEALMQPADRENDRVHFRQSAGVKWGRAAAAQILKGAAPG